MPDLFLSRFHGPDRCMGSEPPKDDDLSEFSLQTDADIDAYAGRLSISTLAWGDGERESAVAEPPERILRACIVHAGECVGRSGAVYVRLCLFSDRVRTTESRMADSRNASRTNQEMNDRIRTGTDKHG